VLVRVVGALALGAGVLSAGAQRADAFPTLLYVRASIGVDTGNCQTSTTPCQTISYALTQAPVGAMIVVGDGTYPEQLTISQSVTIFGNGARTVIEPTSLPSSGTDPDSATPQDYVVGVTPGTTGVILKNLAVSGAGAASTFTSCADNFVGVYFHDASGGIGSVRVSGMQLPSGLGTCAKGSGIFVASDAGHTSTVSISHTSVSGYQQNGITCDDAGTSCTVVLSAVRGSGTASLVSQNGIEVHGASASITGTGVAGNSFKGGGAGNQGHGLYLLNAGTLLVKQNRLWSNDVDLYAGEVPALGLVPPTTGAWSIVHNGASFATDDTAGGSAGDGYGDGIVIDSTSNTVQVTRNITKGDADFGIALLGATGVAVTRNIEVLDYNGLYVGGPGSAVSASTGNTLSMNDAKHNHHDGIAADVGTTESGNTFTSDKGEFNQAVQMVDLSTGAGTAKTANTWTGNKCHHGPRSSPTGLC